MMKLILALSLIGNVVLGYFLLSAKEEAPRLERVIIETHAEGRSEKTTPRETKKVPGFNLEKEEQKTSAPLPEIPHFEAVEFQDAGEKMETDRNEFFIQQLGMSEEKIAEHQRLREEFHRKSSEFWAKKPMQEPSFDERRKMIDLEEEYHQSLEKLHGSKNWERYQKFRENYNQKGFKEQTEENRPFIFMGI